jgi:FKBP-type peptidyl-prolyl cis-trans isomerase SlyD
VTFWLSKNTPASEQGDRMNEAIKVVDGLVVTMDYTLTVDGELIDTSEGQEPIEFIQGTGSIVSGLERELYGMVIGDGKDVDVTAQDGYGEVDEEANMEVPRQEFPTEIPLEIGTMLELHDQDGNPMHARIDQVGEKTVLLDFNHPLAGKDLHFSIKIAGLRLASPEELDHGHVHEAGHEH